MFCFSIPGPYDSGLEVEGDGHLDGQRVTKGPGLSTFPDLHHPIAGCLVESRPGSSLYQMPPFGKVTQVGKTSESRSLEKSPPLQILIGNFKVKDSSSVTPAFLLVFLLNSKFGGPRDGSMIGQA